MQSIHTATAFWITGYQRGEFRTAQLPACDDGHVLVRTLYSAISKGTESLVFNGSVPDTEYSRMRAPFQEGHFPYPVKYGYINVGRIEQGPESLLGQTVFCLYPHQDAYVVPIEFVTPLPDNVPAQRAVLCANLETAINALWDAQPAIGDKITVIGAGVVGALVAWLAAQMPGCDVELIDVVEERAEIANALGVRFTPPSGAQSDRDLIIHASATEQGLTQALELAAFEATILELSWHGDKLVSLPLGGAFHSRRLQLKSSQVGHIATTNRARWNFKRRLELTMSLLGEDALDVLVSGESDFEKLPDALHMLGSNSRKMLCHRIKYPT